MSVSIRSLDRKPWKILALSGRVDAFSDKRVVAGLKNSAPLGVWIALDLSGCEFMSLWALKEVAAWGREQETAGGQFVVLSPRESIRRQLDVFIGPQLTVYSSLQQLEVETFYKIQRGSLVERQTPSS